MKNVVFLIVIICACSIPVFAANPGFRKNTHDFLPHLFQNVSLPKNKSNILNPFGTPDMVVTTFIRLHYAKAGDVAKLLTQKSANFVSKHGGVAMDARTNALWVRDTSANVDTIIQFVQKIDVPVRQIQIAAQIVNINYKYMDELGIKFGTEKETSVTDKSGLNMDVPANSFDLGHFSVAVAKLGNNALLDLELSALESEGHGKVVARPKLITLNNQSAHIESGEEIPYQERTSEGNTNIAFKKAVLGLKVTPEIIGKNRILLHILVNQDNISLLTVNGVPALDTREIKTQVMANNHQTIVLGGIYEQDKEQVIARVPFLSKVPVFGYLFQHKSWQSERKELLIFITPAIVV